MKIEIKFELYIFFDRLIIWMISSKHIQRIFRKYTTDVYLVKRQVTVPLFELFSTVMSRMNIDQLVVVFSLFEIHHLI